MHFLLSDPDFWKNIPKGCGVYRVHCLNGNGEVVPIPRVLGVDPRGVLYIGKATSFAERVSNLKKTISPDYQGQSHVCGRRYKNKTYESFGQRFPFHRLCVSFEPSAAPAVAEAAALTAYVQQFGELPPLNRQG
jgi:hypothetical protein